ncbi:MAG TPA: hypothetical protein VGG48_09115 [Rhizomicrobium sp.]|jgi:hypothetical protein
MNRGFYLTLMMGGFNASPVPQIVIDALTEVQVTSSIGAQGGFQLKFTWGKNAPLAQLHASGFFDPRQRVIIAVTVNGQTEVLMDGIITKQDLAPSGQAGKSTLSITGLDLTALMDFIDLTGILYPALPTFVIVEMVMAKYAVLGIVPIAIPPILSLIQNPIEQILKQVGTDYAYIKRLASSASAMFYLDPGPTPGRSTAYWGPDITKLFGNVQGAISIDLDANTNLDSMSFSYDGTLAVNYLVTFIEPNTKLPIPVPLPSLDLVRMVYAANAPTPLKYTQLTPAASVNPVKTALDALGKMFDDPDVVTGSGSMDVLRYGQVFKARQIAQVRGAGAYYDGKYYVKSVTHNIKRGEYKQNFTLARGGLGSTISTVSL